MNPVREVLPGRSIRRALLLLFIGSFVLRMVVAWWAMPRQNGAPQHGQYREYIMSGTRLLQRGRVLSSFIEDDERASVSAVMPPLYAVLVAGVYGVLGVETAAATWVLTLVNALAGASVVVGVFLIGGRLGGPRVGWLAAIIACVNPMLLGYTHFVWDTCLFSLGVVVSVWWSMCLGESDRASPWRDGIAFGLWLGLLAQLNPALTIAYPLLVLWPLSRRHGWTLRPVAGGVAWVVTGWLIAIMPWTVRNYVQFDDLFYIRSGLGADLWLGVCPEAEADGGTVFVKRYPLLNRALQAHVAQIGEQAYLAECRDRAFASIRSNPVRYAGLVAVRAVDYWFGTVFSHAPPGASGWPPYRTRAIGTLFAMLEMVALGVFLALRRTVLPPARWLLGMVAVFSIVYVATHVQTRFRAPMEPLVAIVLALTFGARSNRETSLET